jgi:hypothetical protein
VIFQRAIWLYFRFPLSFRDVEEMLAERGNDVSYETVRRWMLKFGPAFAANIKASRPRPSGTWHLDEVFVRIGGKRYETALPCSSQFPLTLPPARLRNHPARLKPVLSDSAQKAAISPGDTENSHSGKYKLASIRSFDRLKDNSDTRLFLL